MKVNNLVIGGRRFVETRGELLCPSYMTEMIKRNRYDGLIPFDLSHDGDVRVIYEVDVRKCLKQVLVDRGADEKWLRGFIYSLDRILAYCGEFLINPDFIVTDIDHIYLRNLDDSVGFMFNPHEANDFNTGCRSLIAGILGNYFTDHGVSGEVFRERLLRETGRKEFNPRNILSGWEDLSYSPEKTDREMPAKKEPGQWINKDFIKEFINGRKKQEETSETTALGNITGTMCLAGICSINTRIPVEAEGVTIGRGMLNKEYGLNNSGIGKIHARIYEQDGRIYASDLGSRNGTYLNGERLNKRTPVVIEKGDIIAFSDEEFILC